MKQIEVNKIAKVIYDEQKWPEFRLRRDKVVADYVAAKKRLIKAS